MTWNSAGISETLSRPEEEVKKNGVNIMLH